MSLFFLSPHIPKPKLRTLGYSNPRVYPLFVDMQALEPHYATHLHNTLLSNLFLFGKWSPKKLSQFLHLAHLGLVACPHTSETVSSEASPNSRSISATHDQRRAMMHGMGMRALSHVVPVFTGGPRIFVEGPDLIS